MKWSLFESTDDIIFKKGTYQCMSFLILFHFYYQQRRHVGIDDVDGPHAITDLPSHEQAIAELANDSTTKNVQTLGPRPDGLVRETKTKKVVSREEVEERTETEDVKHLGDFSDEVSADFRVLFKEMYIMSVVMIWTCTGYIIQYITYISYVT